MTHTIAWTGRNGRSGNIRIDAPVTLMGVPGKGRGGWLELSVKDLKAIENRFRKPFAEVTVEEIVEWAQEPWYAPYVGVAGKVIVFSVILFFGLKLMLGS